MAQVAGLFQIYRLLKALSHSRLSPYSISLGDYIYILAFGVEEGSIIGRGHIFN
jgi:hypothetical protein